MIRLLPHLPIAAMTATPVSENLCAAPPASLDGPVAAESAGGQGSAAWQPRVIVGDRDRWSGGSGRVGGPGGKDGGGYKKRLHLFFDYARQMFPLKGIAEEIDLSRDDVIFVRTKAYDDGRVRISYGLRRMDGEISGTGPPEGFLFSVLLDEVMPLTVSIAEVSERNPSGILARYEFVSKFVPIARELGYRVIAHAESSDRFLNFYMKEGYFLEEVRSEKRDVFERLFSFAAGAGTRYFHKLLFFRDARQAASALKPEIARADVSMRLAFYDKAAALDILFEHIGTAVSLLRDGYESAPVREAVADALEMLEKDSPKRRTMITEDFSRRLDALLSKKEELLRDTNRRMIKAMSQRLAAATGEFSL